MQQEEKLTDDQVRYARDALAREFDYRRHQVWRIFAWAASVQLAIVGAVVALTSHGSFSMRTEHRWMLTASTAIVSMHAVAWVYMQTRLKRNVENVLRSYDRQLGIMHQLPDAVRPVESASFGYVPTLALLTVTVLITIWVSSA